MNPEEHIQALEGSIELIHKEYLNLVANRKWDEAEAKLIAKIELKELVYAMEAAKKIKK